MILNKPCLGNSVAEYMLPTAIFIVVLVGSVTFLGDSLMSFFADTLNTSNSSGSLQGQEFGSPVGSNSYAVVSRLATPPADNEIQVCGQSFCYNAPVMDTGKVETAGGNGNDKVLAISEAILSLVEEMREEGADESLIALIEQLAREGQSLADIMSELKKDTWGEVLLQADLNKKANELAELESQKGQDRAGMLSAAQDALDKFSNGIYSSAAGGPGHTIDYRNYDPNNPQASYVTVDSIDDPIAWYEAYLDYTMEATQKMDPKTLSAYGYSRDGIKSITDLAAYQTAMAQQISQTSGCSGGYFCIDLSFIGKGMADSADAMTRYAAVAEGGEPSPEVLAMIANLEKKMAEQRKKWAEFDARGEQRRRQLDSKRFKALKDQLDAFVEGKPELQEDLGKIMDVIDQEAETIVTLTDATSANENAILTNEDTLTRESADDICATGGGAAQCFSSPNVEAAKTVGSAAGKAADGAG